MELNIVHEESCLKGLKKLPDNSVHCVVTSPPYWGLRDYGHSDQLGLEKTPELYIRRMVRVFDEVKRVLRDDGTLWLNIGDSYASHGGIYKSSEAQGKYNYLSSGAEGAQKKFNKLQGNIKAKDLIGIPWMLAFALRKRGWYLRQDIIWNKPNCMPESVRDRCTKSHEYIFMFSKSAHYYYDHVAIQEPCIYDVNGDGTAARKARVNDSDKSAPDAMHNGIRAGFKDAAKFNGKHTDKQKGHSRRHDGFNDHWDAMTKAEQCTGMRNKRSVWTVSPAQFKEAHFATFPEKLIVDCIKAGTSEYGCCSKCGAPYERIADKTLVPTTKASYNSKPDERDRIADKLDQGSNRMKDGHKPGWVNITETKGWQPGCDCHASVVPAIVVDNFMGAWTTALVARKLGRNFIGWEINKAYNAIGEKRLRNELGLFN